MVPSVSPLNKKEPNGIQETNIRPTEPVVVVVVVVVVIQMDFNSGLQSQNFINATPRFDHIQTHQINQENRASTVLVLLLEVRKVYQDVLQ